MASSTLYIRHVFHDEVDQCEDMHEDDLVENEDLDLYVPRGEPSLSQIWCYITLSEVKKLMENNIKTAVAVATRCKVT